MSIFSTFLPYLTLPTPNILARVAQVLFVLEFILHLQSHYSWSIASVFKLGSVYIKFGVGSFFITRFTGCCYSHVSSSGQRCCLGRSKQFLLVHNRTASTTLSFPQYKLVMISIFHLLRFFSEDFISMTSPSLICIGDVLLSKAFVIGDVLMSWYTSCCVALSMP